MELAWKIQEGKRYVVYRMSSEQSVQISTILKAGTFTDPDGTASSTYKVRTISSAGTLGDFSPVVTVSATP
ncbi:hypothetical protein [Deinococcus aerolatus]|uniref:hypothetical protein n=1 Tax=Deinococcus aerolatus TaxID=522487 RepID=UPI00166A4E10|nr:hypothetical protein [Deinococcus aerolatus]